MPGLVAQAQGCAKPDDGTASRKATRWHQGCALRDGMHQPDHLRKSNHSRYFGNVTLRRLCDSYSVTHTQTIAGAYLESTRARTSATVAQRPASISEMPRIALTASSTSCGERCGCSGVMLPDMDDSTIMPQIIPQIASLLLKINVPHCLVTLIKKCCCLPFYGHKVLYNRGMVKFS